MSEFHDNVIKYTIERKEFPGIVNERLFKCWKCKNHMSWFRFNNASANDADSFEDVLEAFSVGYHPCCKRCKHQLVIKYDFKPC